MKRAYASLKFVAGVVILGSILVAAQENVLHAFGSNGDGETPLAAVISDKSGNLYGATSEGGAYGIGTVYELVRPTSGQAWTEKVLYSFGTNSGDGGNPAAGLVLDSAGNLYGSTFANNGAHLPTVFELSPPGIAGGSWTESVIYTFSGSGKGNSGVGTGGLVFGKGGRLYGVTVYGGADNGGVFELQPPTVPGGAWKEAPIFDFDVTDGQEPEYGGASLTFDTAGNLYGTTVFGGTTDNGVAFELSPPVAGGAWIETILYNFGATPTDGIIPVCKLIFDSAGNLYGTTSYGGANNQGTVFELSPPSVPGNPWVESILHNFTGADGSDIRAGVIFDKAGNLYGTALLGGSGHAGDGTVYELSPPAVAGEPWTETTLHNFTGGADGGWAFAGLLMAPSGILYGTASLGGVSGCQENGCGVIYEVKP